DSAAPRRAPALRRFGVGLALGVRVDERGERGAAGVHPAERRVRVEREPEAPREVHLRDEADVGMRDRVADEVGTGGLARELLERRETAPDPVAGPRGAVGAERLLDVELHRRVLERLNPRGDEERELTG